MTELELANKLKEMYNSYEKPCGVHLFGIKYADEIAKHNSKLSPIVDSIVEQAGIPDSYGTEVKKGIKIAKHLPSIDINLASSSRNQRPKSDIITKTPPLNQILYGPPGTGKTYSTIALLTAIRALNLPYGSEIITMPFTFAATPHCISWNGCKPVFCDIEPRTMTIDTDKIEDLITSQTSAILGVMCMVFLVMSINLWHKCIFYIILKSVTIIIVSKLKTRIFQ